MIFAGNHKSLPIIFLLMIKTMRTVLPNTQQWLTHAHAHTHTETHAYTFLTHLILNIWNAKWKVSNVTQNVLNVCEVVPRCYPTFTNAFTLSELCKMKKNSDVFCHRKHNDYSNRTHTHTHICIWLLTATSLSVIIIFDKKNFFCLVIFDLIPFFVNRTKLCCFLFFL